MINTDDDDTVFDLGHGSTLTRFADGTWEAVTGQIDSMPIDVIGRTEGEVVRFASDREAAMALAEWMDATTTSPTVQEYEDELARLEAEYTEHLEEQGNDDEFELSGDALGSCETLQEARDYVASVQDAYRDLETAAEEIYDELTREDYETQAAAQDHARAARWNAA